MFKNSLWLEYLLIAVVVAIVIIGIIVIVADAPSIQGYLDKPLRDISVGNLVLVLFIVNLLNNIWNNIWRYDAKG